VEIDERDGQPGPQAGTSGRRCSDKGFLFMSVSEYVSLLDWTARQTAAGKRGFTPREAPPIFERLSVPPDVWCDLVEQFGRLFCHMVGRVEKIEGSRSRVRGHRYHVRHQARQLLSSPV
jgi:hypothetical protein